jgi:hypothetical protein
VRAREGETVNGGGALPQSLSLSHARGGPGGAARGGRERDLLAAYEHLGYQRPHSAFSVGLPDIAKVSTPGNAIEKMHTVQTVENFRPTGAHTASCPLLSITSGSRCVCMHV